MILFNRLIALALSLLLVLGGAFVMGVALGWIATADVHQAPFGSLLIASITDRSAYQRYLYAASGGASFLMGALLFVLELRSSRAGRAVTIRKDKLGCVSVSLIGLRHLAEHVIGEIAGIEGVVSEARSTRQGLTFNCRVELTPESRAPELAEEIRDRLGAAIRHHVGQPAVRIHVHTRMGKSALSRNRVR